MTGTVGLHTVSSGHHRIAVFAHDTNTAVFYFGTTEYIVVFPQRVTNRQVSHFIEDGNVTLDGVRVSDRTVRCRVYDGSLETFEERLAKFVYEFGPILFVTMGARRVAIFRGSQQDPLELACGYYYTILFPGVADDELFDRVKNDNAVHTGTVSVSGFTLHCTVSHDSTADFEERLERYVEDSYERI